MQCDDDARLHFHPGRGTGGRRQLASTGRRESGMVDGRLDRLPGRQWRQSQVPLRVADWDRDAERAQPKLPETALSVHPTLGDLSDPGSSNRLAVLIFDVDHERHGRLQHDVNVLQRMAFNVRSAKRSREPGSFDRQHEVTDFQTRELVGSRLIGRGSRARDLETSPTTIQRFQAIQGDLRPAMAAADAFDDLPRDRRWAARFRRRRDGASLGDRNLAGSSNQEQHGESRTWTAHRKPPDQAVLGVRASRGAPSPQVPEARYDRCRIISACGTQGQSRTGLDGANRPALVTRNEG